MTTPADAPLGDRLCKHCGKPRSKHSASSEAFCLESVRFEAADPLPKHGVVESLTLETLFSILRTDPHARLLLQQHGMDPDALDRLL